MAFAHIANHAAEALGRLACQFKGTRSHAALLNAYSRQVQDIEDAIWGVVATLSIDTSSGAQLDRIGKVVGRPRQNHTDAQYRAYLRAQILLNRSSGTLPELLAMLSTVLAGYGANELIGTTWSPAAIIIQAIGAIGAAEPGLLADLLRKGSDAGVLTVFEWSPADAAHTLTCSAPQSDGNGLPVPAQGLASVATAPNCAGSSSIAVDAGFNPLALGFSAGGGSVVVVNGNTCAQQVSTYAAASTSGLTGLSPAVPATWACPIYISPAGAGILAGAAEG